MRVTILGLALLTLGAPLAAQDLEFQEIVVTGSRIDQDDYSNDMPAVGLRRAADFLVQMVVIRGDTRDMAQRRKEIRAMLADAIRRAGSAGVELAYGDYILTRLTSENVDEITLQSDNRPDSERVLFLVKARLGGAQSGEAAEAQIERYMDAVPEVGRAQMDILGDATLSIVGPDSFRPQIAEKIAEDANAMARRIGDGYSVEIEGLNMPVQWARSGPGEVLLYIPYKLTIVPRP
ncbi:TonB-dependent receptor [Qipengyuania marisflavi]|uniref:TonB-dependent receptor n=1 Tax=Qipengyuania marisflavi TaxID=2486356 RepID=A0A5S3PC48_9SPHN|nr:TonB-dependent receptor [Qipengyuania marisflavi]TMM50335.1 TonB-dependent receptor [Qipengyuania marisflavi]